MEERKLIVVCEWPLQDGWSKDFVTRTLLREGINVNEVTWFNLLPERPYAGDVRKVPAEARTKAGEAILEHLKRYPTGVILTLGDHLTELLTGERGIDKWQASILRRGSQSYIPCYSTDRVTRDLSLQVWVSLCCRKAATELKSPPAQECRYDFLLNPPFDDAIAFLRRAAKSDELSVDIETGRGQINTVGFAISPTSAIAINVLPDRLSARNHNTLWSEIRNLLEGPQPKILQNFIYETLFFSRYGIRLNNVTHDTMICQKFLWPEFEMGLDAVGRMYTEMPYWKEDGKSWNSIRDWQRHYEYNCLWKSTKVLTEQGPLTIEEIVRRKLKISVLSWNEQSRQCEFRPVTNWLCKKQKTPVEWIRVETEGLAGRKGLFITPDHKIMTSRGWIEAQYLRKGDFMLTEGTRHDAGTLLGTVLGDSSLQSTTDPTVAYMSCSHVHEELTALKYSLFGGTRAKPRKVVTSYGTSVVHELYVPASPQLARLKKADLESTLQHLTSMGIALWFMDDGCKQKGTYPRMKLALQSYSPADRRLIRRFFCYRYQQKAFLDAAGNLTFGIKMSRLLCDEISALVPETLRYKLAYPGDKFDPEHCVQYKTQFKIPVNVRITRVSKEQKQGRYANKSYCISVEGNENFFTEYGVVANCKDTVGTYAGYLGQIADLRERGLEDLYRDYITKLFPAVTEMCSRGIPISEETLKGLRAEVSGEYQTVLAALKGTPGAAALNPRSPAQVKVFLQGKGYKIPKKYDSATKRYKESTDEKSLKKLRMQHPEDLSLSQLLRLSKLGKAESSYLNFKYDNDKRMRYSLIGGATETMRWAGYCDPWDNGVNPQTVPGGNKGINIKKIFRAEPGHTFLQLDLKQAESRFVAYDAPDANLIATLEDPTRDIHKEVAAEIYGVPVSGITKQQRQLGKKSGHGANYSMKEMTFIDSCIQEMDLVLSKPEATKVLEAYHRLFPGIRQWHAKIRRELAQTRRLKTPWGWERYFWGRLDDDMFRQAYAFRPQSTIPFVTNQLMLALLQCRTEGQFSFRLLLQCHDSLLLEVPCESGSDNVAGISHFAEQTELWHPQINLAGGRLIIPVSHESGNSWGELE